MLVSADSLGEALWAAGCSRFTTCKAREWMFYLAGAVMEDPNVLGICLHFIEIPFTFKVKHILERLESGGGDEKLGR